MKKWSLVNVALVLSILAMIWESYVINELNAKISRLQKPTVDGLAIPGRTEPLYNGVHYDFKTKTVYCANSCGAFTYKIPD